MGDEAEAVEVPFVEQLRDIPKDFTVSRETHWSDTGTAIGHQFIPVGFMFHRAADEIERLRTLLQQETPVLGECEECGHIIVTPLKRLPDRERDTERLFYVCDGFDGYDDWDFHGEATKFANGGEATKEHYLAAYRSVIDAMMKKRQSPQEGSTNG